MRLSPTSPGGPSAGQVAGPMFWLPRPARRPRLEGRYPAVADRADISEGRLGLDFGQASGTCRDGRGIAGDGAKTWGRRYARRPQFTLDAYRLK
jgi:hypothetical protein